MTKGGKHATNVRQQKCLQDFAVGRRKLDSSCSW